MDRRTYVRTNKRTDLSSNLLGHVLGDNGGGHWLVRTEWCPAGLSVSVNLPWHYKVQKRSSGTGSPGWSRKRAVKTVVVGIVQLLLESILNEKTI